MDTSQEKEQEQQPQKSNDEHSRAPLKCRSKATSSNGNLSNENLELPRRSRRKTVSSNDAKWYEKVAVATSRLAQIFSGDDDDDEEGDIDDVTNQGEQSSNDNGGFDCPINGCSKVLLKKVNIKRHLREFHGTRLPDGRYARKRIRCSICSKVCLNISNFNQHHDLKHGKTVEKESTVHDQFSKDQLKWTQ